MTSLTAYLSPPRTVRLPILAVVRYKPRLVDPKTILRGIYDRQANRHWRSNPVRSVALLVLDQPNERPSYWRYLPVGYLDLSADDSLRLAEHKAFLRRAELELAAVQHLPAAPWSAAHRWNLDQRSYLSKEAASARKSLKRLRDKLELGPTPKFWKPLPAAAADKRIARQFDPKETLCMWRFARVVQRLERMRRRAA